VQVAPTPARIDAGLGIGLAVVRRLVELHDGRVVAVSPGIDQGSQFIVRLPIAQIDGARSHERVPNCSRQFRVCVVEDVRDIAYMMRKLLEKLGHEVTAAHDGEQGLEMILQGRPDVAFIDIGLPGLSGYEIAERLTQDQRVRGVVLVALTGYGQPQDRQRALDAGFHYHLVKPASYVGLRQMLAEIADRPTSEP
jgi:CheY-like chemotaxis protein